MASDNNNQAPQPKTCLGGCGFWGNGAFQGYCSKCFRDLSARSPALFAQPAPVNRTVEPLAGGLGERATAEPVGAAATSGELLAAASQSLPATSVSAMSGPAVSRPDDDNVDMTDASPSASSVGAAATTAASVLSSPVPLSSAGAGSASPFASVNLLPALTGAVSSSPATAAASESSISAPSVPSIALGEGVPASPGVAAVQVNKSRCMSCKKKVGLTGFECRCGFIFCGTHRYADAHSCTFDYKTHDRTILAKLNPQVKAAKVEHI